MHYWWKYKMEAQWKSVLEVPQQARNICHMFHHYYSQRTLYTETSSSILTDALFKTAKKQKDNDNVVHIYNVILFNYLKIKV